MQKTPHVSFCLLAVCLAIPQSRPAQAQMDMAAGDAHTMDAHTMETRDEISPGDLPVPRAMTGIGNSHLQITATPEAQVWFDQGLNLLNDFWDYESARAFEQSIRVDPQCAMCYWGLYKAESFYLSTAQGYASQSLVRAVALKDRVSEREGLYIDASAAHEEAVKSAVPGPALAREVQIWRKLVQEYPKDTQARVFLAGRVGVTEGLAMYRSILKDYPEDSAANHHYIHALEATPHPELALHSAEILPGLAPASGHMVHMPGHIFFLIGDYARAEQAFAASMQVDERYMQEQHVQPDNDWNYVHNLMYAIANLMEEGKLAAATELSMKLTGARGELASTLYIGSARDSISRLNPRLPVALRTADWAQVAALLKGRAQAKTWPNLGFLARQLVTFAAGMQAAEAKDVRKAEESSTQFEAELRRMSLQPENVAVMPADPAKLQVMPDAELRPLLRNLSIMSLELRASLLTVQGHPTDAKSLFVKAAQAEKALGYHEPPGYIRPVGETEATAMMAIGDWTDALAAWEQALLERPRSGFPLYGIAECREKAGERDAAAKAYVDFLAAWKDADSALPQVLHARTYLAGQPAGTGRAQ